MTFGIHINGRHSLRTGHGHWQVIDPDKGNTNGDSYMCPHCNNICFVTAKQLGGYCNLCNKQTCGKERCHECIPFEQKLEAEEARDRLGRAIGLHD